ncbi:MAG TPA: asparaginase [Gemmatimonadales bacterium]|nr:asparaginase [Gemmatimonadales bacterium]
MPSTPFRVELTRGDLVESVHSVALAATDSAGALVATAGDPDLVTFWRSAAKPFQAMGMVAGGAADHYGLGPEAIALACASHSSEPVHVALAGRMLEAIGCREEDLACGPHPPISSTVHEAALRAGTPITPAWSNCSGKHAGMLALARHQEWPTSGYERAGHPVQERILDEVVRWTGVSRDEVVLGVDGCTTACFALPLRAMALAYARLGVSVEPAAVRVREAMLRHPELVGGTRRPCTDLMRESGGTILAKIGAEGVYSAAWPALGLGLSLKVTDGDSRSAPVALLGALAQVAERFGVEFPAEALAWHARPELRNTRRQPTGVIRSAGDLQFHGTTGVRRVPSNH